MGQKRRWFFLHRCFRPESWHRNRSRSHLLTAFFLIVFPEQCRVLPADPPASYEQGDEDKTDERPNTCYNPEQGNFIWFFRRNWRYGGGGFDWCSGNRSQVGKPCRFTCQ